MFIKKIKFLFNINNLFKNRKFSSISDNFNEECPKFVTRTVIKKIPVKVKVKAIKLIPKLKEYPSDVAVANKLLTVEKILKVSKPKRFIKGLVNVKKPLLIRKTNKILIPKTKKILVKRKTLLPKIKTISVKNVIKVLKKRIVKRVRIVKKRVLKEKKKVLKKKKKVLKKKKPKLIPLGPMPDFYKLKRTKRISFIGISFRQNRRLVNKPWLKKRKFNKPSKQKGKITITFRVGKRRLKNGRKISKRHYIERWKYVFARRNKNRNKKRVYLFYNRKRNNTFITLTNGRGQVLVSQSAGYCKIKSKKKKRSPDTLKAIAYSVARAARLKNIRYIYKMYSKNRHMKSRRAIFNEFKRVGLMILVNVIVKSRPHSLYQRRKKPKRL